MPNSNTMAYLNEDFIAFFKDLSKNNHREWFHANKKRYEAAVKNPFKQLVQSVIDELNKTEEIPIEPKDAIFRINRDIRFSKDKTPYKTHVSAIISKKGRKDKAYPGYYLHLSHGELSMGGGAYFLEKGPLQAVRQQVMLQGERFAQIIADSNFVEHFGEIKGEQNKRLPTEFREAAQQQPLLANKQYYFMAEMDPKLALKDDFLPLIMEHFQAGKALNDFLVEAIYS